MNTTEPDVAFLPYIPTTPKEIEEAHRLGRELLEAILAWKRENMPLPNFFPLQFSRDAQPRSE